MKKYTPKEKEKFAIENRRDLVGKKKKWMQEWIDWRDKTIPIGRRRVAYVRYLTMTKGMTLDAAKYQAKKYIN